MTDNNNGINVGGNVGGDVVGGDKTTTSAASSKKNLGQKIVDILSYIPFLGFLSK